MNRKNPPVHNHGPQGGLGLACPESVVGRFLQGACLRATEQASQSPHMASKYWAELVKARHRIEVRAKAVEALDRLTQIALDNTAEDVHAEVYGDAQRVRAEWQESRKVEAARSDTDEVLAVLSVLNETGGIAYDDYVQLHDAVSRTSQPVQVEVTDDRRRQVAEILVVNGIKPHNPAYYNLIVALAALGGDKS